MKVCSKCKIEKDLSEFYKRLGRPSGVTSRCKECLNSNHNRHDSYKVREYDMKRTYGIGHEQYSKLLDSQNSVCGICKIGVIEGKRKKYLSIDHCHTTNKTRGLLCDSCNRALGLFKDSENILQLAINYLLKSKEQTI